MKIRTMILSLLATLLMVGCDEHVDVVDLSLKVGNVYRVDGSIVPPSHHVGQRDEAPQAVGVVVAVGTTSDKYTALVMALEDLDESYWFSGITDDTDVSTDVKAFNGKENTAMLLSEYAKNKELDPTGAIMAGAYQAGGITGWHLPSVGEMLAAVNNRETVSNTLKMLHVTGFTGEWYLTTTADGTSSETKMLYNYCIIMPEGRVNSKLKTELHKVRPFMIIR